MSSLLRKFTSDTTETKNPRPVDDIYAASQRSRDFGSPSTPAMPSRHDQNKTNLCSDVEFKGTISFKDFLRLDGKFEGELNSPGTLIIGENGVVKAEISVGNVIVEGKVYGNITAQDKIELRGAAQLFGDIKATRLVISEGVVFVGKSDVNPNNKVEKAAPRSARPEDAYAAPDAGDVSSTPDLLGRQNYQA
ncbi:MAG TPA: polymer-forming cytoskeletal protein [bacterium]|nr:polymer-forming cytoskeletal protein [bacterium]